MIGKDDVVDFCYKELYWLSDKNEYKQCLKKDIRERLKYANCLVQLILFHYSPDMDDYDEEGRQHPWGFSNGLLFYGNHDGMYERDAYQLDYNYRLKTQGNDLKKDLIEEYIKPIKCFLQGYKREDTDQRKN